MQYTDEPFDPTEQDTFSLEKESAITPVRSFSTGGHEHYWESHGIQQTGEQVVKCKHCPLGMEIEPDRRVIDGVIIWS